MKKLITILLCLVVTLSFSFASSTLISVNAGYSAGKLKANFDGITTEQDLTSVGLRLQDYMFFSESSNVGLYTSCTIAAKPIQEGADVSFIFEDNFNITVGIAERVVKFNNILLLANFAFNYESQKEAFAKASLTGLSVGVDLICEIYDGFGVNFGFGASFPLNMSMKVLGASESISLLGSYSFGGAIGVTYLY